MHLTHLGHACLLVDVGGTRVLIDPGTFSAGFDDLTGLAAVVVTHQHADHVDLERLPALLAANPDAVVAADPQTVAVLAEHAVTTRSLVTLTAGETVHLDGVDLEPVGELHAVNHSGVPRCTNVGVVVRGTGDHATEPVLYHPGDALDGEPGPVDVLAVPLSGPWCKVSESIDFVRRIAPSRLVAIHDALLSDVGRQLYVTHLSTFGGSEGAALAFEDLSGGAAREVTRG